MTIFVGDTDRPGGAPRASVASVLAVSMRQFAIAARVLVGMTVILGVLYPLLIWGFAQVAVPGRANGSLVTGPSGTVVGSTLVGQQFTGPQWFWPRPSVAGAGYDAMASGGSNLAADSPALRATIADRRAALAAANHVAPSAIPPDAVTASASGLDPDISPAYALVQVDRIAAARGVPAATVRQLVVDHVQGKAWGFIGQSTVNVLQLNLALEKLDPAKLAPESLAPAKVGGT
ncbi:MAG: potassium-transporting ATPase subunit KdpC [Actinobacteria bacterium]|nr:potassium-transporting ATPase subunit KdpC [Actinomycetota bacterium]